MTIRKAVAGDVGRLAEIIVFNNRMNYYPIFKDMVYSFSEYTVENVAKQFSEDAEFMNNCYVFEDLVLKGFICVVEGEIKKLYVDVFFQNEGIGTQLLKYALESMNANNLWALEKNYKALSFYKRNGFSFTGRKCFEEGTMEYLVHLIR